MTRALHFATKLNSRDIKNCNYFWVPYYDNLCSHSSRYFPRQWRQPAYTDWEHVGVSVTEVICHKIPWIHPWNVNRAKCMLMVNPSQVALEGDSRDLLYQKFLQPFMPQYPHTNSPHRYPYISLEDQLREFDLTKSKHFPISDRFIYSHSVFCWRCTDIVERKFMLITLVT